jgi:hypothetical protein
VKEIETGRSFMKRVPFFCIFLCLSAVLVMGQTSTTSAVDALAKGITAQQSGAAVEALGNYYLATALDPKLSDAAKRVSVVSAEIRRGSIGTNARNDIQRRKEWVDVISEAIAFYKANRPKAPTSPNSFEIIYSPKLTEGRIDYEKETMELSFNIGLFPDYAAWTAWHRTRDAMNQFLDDIKAGLDQTGRSNDWGFFSWPYAGGTIPKEATVSVYNDGCDMAFTIEAQLKNSEGKQIGISSTAIKYAVSASGSLNEPSVATVLFKGVNANDITDTMTVTLVRINKESPEMAIKAGHIAAVLTDSIMDYYNPGVILAYGSPRETWWGNI